jgi:hypothetical protein
MNVSSVTNFGQNFDIWAIFVVFGRNDLGEFFFMNHIIFHQISLAKKIISWGAILGNFCEVLGDFYPKRLVTL